jgi:hypothetical protein
MPCQARPCGLERRAFGAGTGGAHADEPSAVGRQHAGSGAHDQRLDDWTRRAPGRVTPACRARGQAEALRRGSSPGSRAEAGMCSTPATSPPSADSPQPPPAPTRRSDRASDRSLIADDARLLSRIPHAPNPLRATHTVAPPPVGANFRGARSGRLSRSGLTLRLMMGCPSTRGSRSN